MFFLHSCFVVQDRICNGALTKLSSNYLRPPLTLVWDQSPRWSQLVVRALTPPSQYCGLTIQKCFPLWSPNVECIDGSRPDHAAPLHEWSVAGRTTSASGSVHWPSSSGRQRGPLSGRPPQAPYWRCCLLHLWVRHCSCCIGNMLRKWVVWGLFVHR